MSASSGSASAPTADDLLKNLLDSVTPTTSSTSSNDGSASKTTGNMPTTTAPAPQPAATTATPAPASTDQSVASTADTKASSSNGSGAGLSIGLAIGAVLLVAFVVLYFRQRKKGRYKVPGHNHDLGTPQLSIELPRPPPLNGNEKPQDDNRVSVFTSVQYGGESVFNAVGEVSPGFQAGMRPALSAQYRASNNPQSGPVSTTFHMDGGGSSAFNPSIVNPVLDSSKTNKLTRVVAGRVPAFDNPRAAPVPTEGGDSLSRDTSASTSSLNSLHDSMCGDFFKHGDGLGERIRAKSRTKHPPMVLEEDEESSNRSNQPSASKIAAAAGLTPKTVYAAPATPLTAPPPPVPAPRRAPPPPPPAAAFVKPPPIAASNTQMYRPSTESEIRFQRLSTMSSDSIGSMKRASTSSTESANPRAGSMIEINEIVGGEGSQRAKEIEI